MKNPSTNHDRPRTSRQDLARNVTEEEAAAPEEEDQPTLADFSTDQIATSPSAERPTITHLSPSGFDERRDSSEASSDIAANDHSAVARWEASDDNAQRFGRFKLLERLGRGGTGDVYRAVHTRLRKEVALKLLPPDRVCDSNARDRFAQQVRLMSGLAHPNLVRLETAGEHEGVPYLVMEYVPGIDLQTLLERCDRIPAADACQLIGQAALGLAHLHEHGLVHRNLQPSNLVVTAEGTVKVTDLGRAVERKEKATAKPMQPGDGVEAEGRDRGVQTDRGGDVFYLGCTLFALLAGQLPFQSVPESETTHCEPMPVMDRCRPLPDITEFRDDLPTGLAEVLSRLTALDPAVRYRTPLEVVAALAPMALGCDVLKLLRRAGFKPTSNFQHRESPSDTAEYLTVQSASLVEPRRLVFSPLSRQHWRLLVLVASLMICGGVGIAAWRSADHTSGSAEQDASKVDSQSDQLDPSASSKPFLAASAFASPSNTTNKRPTNPPDPADTGSEKWSDDDANATPADYHQTPLRKDLLGTVEAQRDAFELDVQPHPDGLIMTNLNGRGILQLPVVIPKQYELEWTVERLGGSGSFGVGFPAAGGKLLAILDHQYRDEIQNGFMHVNRGGVREIEDPQSKPLLPIGQTVHLRLVSNSTGAQLFIRHQHPSPVASESAPESNLVALSATKLAETESTETETTETDGSVGDAGWSSVAKWSSSDASAAPRLGMFDGYYPGVIFLHVFNGSFQVSGMQIPNSNEPPEPQPFLGPDATMERSIAERIVWRGGHVEVLTESGTRTVHQFYDLTKEPWIRGVTKCGGTPRLAIGDETVKRLGEIDDLITLDLRTSDVTDAGLAFLNGLPRLRELLLPTGLLGGDATVKLNDLPALRELNLIHSRVDDRSLSLVKNFPELTSLCLSGTSVTDNGLAKIGTFLPELEHLCLNSCPINGRELDELQNLRKLKDLELSETNVSDDDLSPLVDLPSLTTLHLRDSRVTHAGRDSFQKQRPDVQIK